MSKPVLLTINDLIPCRLLGTPNDQIWPGVSTLRDWHLYPQWKPHNLAQVVPELDSAGIDLLKVSILRALIPSRDAASLIVVECILNLSCMHELSASLPSLHCAHCVFSDLQSMLQYNPASRISAKKALFHPYFNSLDKSQY